MNKTVIYKYDEDSGCWHVFLSYPADPLNGVESQEVEVGSFCHEDEAESVVEAIKEFAGL